MCDLTCAGARDHIGMRFSSVSRPKRSSAEAMKDASTVTTDVLVVVALGFGGGAAGAAAATGGAGEYEEAAPGAGVAFLLVSLEVGGTTVKSRPCVSRSSTGNLANVASRMGGSCFLANAKSASTSLEDAVVSVQLY